MESILKTLIIMGQIMMILLNGKVQSSADHRNPPPELLANLRRALYTNGKQERQLMSNEDVTSNRLSLARLSSSGLNHDSVTVSLFLTGPNDQSLTTKWTIKGYNGVEKRTGGLSYDGHDLYTRVLEVVINNFSGTEAVEFEMATDYQYMIFNLNLTTVENRHDYNFPTPVMEINKTQVTPASGLDLEITAVVKGSQSQRSDFLGAIGVYFEYLNTDLVPPVVRRKGKNNHDSGVFTIDLHRLTSETSQLEITINAQYTKFGGILMVMFDRKVDGSILLGNLYTMYINDIMSYESNEVVPGNNVGISVFTRLTVLSHSFRSVEHIMCVAMGNPKPQVSILKVSADKTTEIPMNTETGIPASSVTSVHILYLPVGDPHSPGTYICRATSGNKTVEEIGEVIVESKIIAFDESETGVMLNTTDQVVISCEASGIPRPTLELRLFYKYGPEMTSSSLFEVSRTEPDDETARIILIVSPSNRDVNTVYCIAKNYLNYEYKRIDVFPGNIYNSIDLYNNVCNSDVTCE